jgi:hypothetical protein
MVGWTVKKIGSTNDYIVVYNTSTRQEKTTPVRGAVSANVSGEELHVRRKDGCLEVINLRTQGRRTIA